MRIEVVDPSGHGLGTAIGLLQLGHEVSYTGSHSSSARRDALGCMRQELVEHMFGRPGPSPSECDLLVLVDVFADHLDCLDKGIGEVGAPVTHALQADAGPLVYPQRLQYFCDRAQQGRRIAVIDMSDKRDQREVAFEALPGVELFAREVYGRGDGAWQPFPFLYNLTMLALEFLRPEHHWLVVKDRPQQWDWAFCGTLAHERYGLRREVAVAMLAKRWPELRGAVLTQIPFQDVLGALQSVRFGLDLAGCGELCFRLHECLALGTPVWRPFASPVALPAGLNSVVFADPANAPELDPVAVRAIYAQHYGPVAAASWLLSAMGFDGARGPSGSQYSISQATSMAAAASR